MVYYGTWQDIMNPIDMFWYRMAVNMTIRYVICWQLINEIGAERNSKELNRMQGNVTLWNVTIYDEPDWDILEWNGSQHESILVTKRGWMDQNLMCLYKTWLEAMNMIGTAWNRIYWNVTIIYGTLKDILEWNPMEQASMKKGWKDTTGYYVSWRKMEGHSVSKRNVFDVEWWYGTGWDGSARHSEITKIRGC